MALSEKPLSSMGSVHRGFHRRLACCRWRVDRAAAGIDPKHALQIRCGCLNGQAQALVTDTSPEALVLADQLEHGGGGAFFAPHAETIRVSYHAYRGELTHAALHRERAEALSLQAGTCWSAMGVLTVRSVLPCVLTGDVISLMRLLSDLERMAPLSAGLGALHELALGHLDLLRADYGRALERYERVFAGAVARKLPTYPIERTLEARARARLGVRTVVALAKPRLDDGLDGQTAMERPCGEPRTATECVVDS